MFNYFYNSCILGHFASKGETISQLPENICRISAYNSEGIALIRTCDRKWGVIDDNGNEIFSDIMGLLLARNFSEKYKSSKFVIDVKSTGLFGSDKILKSNDASVHYWKTGHSYIKQKTGRTILFLC